jgi:phosphoglycerate dehydrogenase-like enzyme
MRIAMEAPTQHVNLWMPDRTGCDAVGELPDGVAVGLIPREGELPGEILDVEFLVPGPGDRRPHGLLARMPALRVIQTLSAGVDSFLPVVPASVTLCDASGSRDVPVAEWVLAAILSAQMDLPEMRDRQREHRWERHRSSELAGSTVMILGYGSIGAAVEDRLAAFGVELIRVARRARPGVHSVEELDSVLPRADILVVLLPLTPSTTGLLDARSLSLLAPGALLVNAARGPIVDTQALVELSQRGRIRAVLDVTDPEPLPREHPLWDAPGVLITPHFAGDTPAGERRAFALVGDQVRRYLRGEPLLNVVEHGY